MFLYFGIYYVEDMFKISVNLIKVYKIQMNIIVDVKLEVILIILYFLFVEIYFDIFVYILQ